MTIKEFILKNEIRWAEERLAKLTEYGAPKIILETMPKQIEEMKKGNIKIGGKVEKLENEMTGFVEKKGRGGKMYIEFNDGTRYFPNAQYGRYIA